MGNRSIEWCQKDQEIHTIDSRLWKGTTCYAFIAEDFQFFTRDKQPLYDKTNLTWESIGYVTIRFRKEKKEHNYEVLSYFKNEANPAFCPIHVALSILLLI